MLLYLLVPWTAVNLVDYYLVRFGNYHVPSFFAFDGGIYGNYNVAALVCYALGIAVQIPFVATDLYTGPSLVQSAASICRGSSDFSSSARFIISPPASGPRPLSP